LKVKYSSKKLIIPTIGESILIYICELNIWMGE